MYIDSFTFVDLLQLNLFLGYPVFAFGMLVMVLIHRQFDWPNLRRARAWVFAFYCAVTTFVLSAIVWMTWPFDFDFVILEFVYIPAVVALTIVLTLTIGSRHLRRRAG